MKKFYVLVLVIISLVLVIIANVFRTEHNIKFNNVINADEMVTITYTKNEISYLKQLIKTKKVSYKEFKSMFNVQCLRKTYQGYYVVLFQDNGSKVFVFMNDSLILNNILVIDEFKSKKDFEHIKSNPNKATIDDVISFDSNTIIFPISAMDFTAHIVQEGIILIKYSRFTKDGLLEKPLVDSIAFIENNDINDENCDLNSLTVPYILKIDKNE